MKWNDSTLPPQKNRAMTAALALVFCSLQAARAERSEGQRSIHLLGAGQDVGALATAEGSVGRGFAPSRTWTGARMTAEFDGGGLTLVLAERTRASERSALAQPPASPGNALDRAEIARCRVDSSLLNALGFSAHELAAIAARVPETDLECFVDEDGRAAALRLRRSNASSPGQTVTGRFSGAYGGSPRVFIGPVDRVGVVAVQTWLWSGLSATQLAFEADMNPGFHLCRAAVNRFSPFFGGVKAFLMGLRSEPMLALTCAGRNWVDVGAHAQALNAAEADLRAGPLPAERSR